MNREERIRRYEEILDRAELAARQMEEAREAWEGIRDELGELEAYYTGPEWKEDYEADEAGLLPAGLKRGVLSEDGIDSVLERFRELGARWETAGREKKTVTGGTGFPVREVTDRAEKTAVTRGILEALPDWFEVTETREAYIRESAELPLFAAYDGGKPVGFLCVMETGSDTAEIHVMGVLKEYHHRGIGTKLFDAVKQYARRAGYSFLQVKTVQMGKYEDYDRTNLFYRSLGFKEFEVFPDLWDEANPCQIYVMGV